MATLTFEVYEREIPSGRQLPLFLRLAGCTG